MPKALRSTPTSLSNKQMSWRGMVVEFGRSIKILTGHGKRADNIASYTPNKKSQSAYNAAVQSCRALYDLRLNAPKGQRQTTGRHASSQSSGPEIGSSRSRTRSSVACNSAQHPLSSAAEPQQRGRRRDPGAMKTFSCGVAVPHCTRATGRSHRHKKTSLSNTERGRTQSHPPKPG